ncbi:MAG: tRNA (adenosine(37)-N6)-threonylcarbamoyltransferase complex ATPase subunit type 1 TsaE [Terriglobales bacterium]
MKVESWPAELRRFVSRAPEETLAFGSRLARALPRPALLILAGSLGAGKTVLAKGLAEGLGVAQADDVASPSYTLIHEYRSAATAFYHIDLYRLETSPQLETLGLEDILPGGPSEGGVIAVEWGAKFSLFEGLPRLLVQFTVAADDSREITTEWRGPAGVSRPVRD